MQQYITELSKYGIAGAMVLYTLGILLGLFLEETRQRVLYVWQCALMFLIQLMCFVDLALISGQMEYVFFYLFVQIFLLTASVMVPLVYEGVNRLLLSGMCMLTGIGLCIVSRLNFNRAVRQYVIALISLMIVLVIPYLFSRIRFLKKLTWAYGLVGLGMLSVVLILGEITNGSKLSFTISLNIAQVTFQPSEFVKIPFIFFLAGILWEDSSFLRVALTSVVAGMHVIVLVMSRDLGSALIFFIGFVFIVFIATKNYLYLLAGAVGGSAASWVAYQLFAHVRNRVLAWQDPWAHIDAQGYAITQSLFAIGSGSWFGMGLLQGNPDDIPYVMEDFIFSSICEELGVIFGICVVIVTVSMFLVMMLLAMRISDRFYQIIVYGVGIMYIFQVFLTVGGGVKLIPLTGVTLPFISYGGSSVMVSMIMFFIVQGIYIQSKQEGGRRVGKKRAASKAKSKAKNE
ncbi:MAG: FtsW/RodA/SpoVE family cell cycle protein [Acetatifactor sp.]|nr:FtsW/RodA/SpoVE family cell cycle protein [Acetatifactor sp.]